jgi:hypothetical protein
VSRVLTISDELHARLEAAARKRGLDSVERLLEVWQTNEDDLSQRVQSTQQIDVLRSRLFSVYGEMPDSTTLIREDRAR